MTPRRLWSSRPRRSRSLRSWGKLRGLAREQQRAWLLTVGRRQLARYARRAKVERRTIERLGIEVPSVDHDDLLLIEQRAGLAELRIALGRELAQLSVEQRQALSLRVVQERPYAEIAELLGVSEDTVRARVSRGLRRLNYGLEQHHATAEGAS